MQIKNLMSEDLITIDKDQNLSDALKLLRKHNVSRLPVTNNKQLVGIISERDIANKLGSSKYENMPASRLHISSVMVKDVITVPQTMQLDEVARIMLDNGIGSLPVKEVLYLDRKHIETQDALILQNFLLGKLYTMILLAIKKNILKQISLQYWKNTKKWRAVQKMLTGSLFPNI